MIYLPEGTILDDRYRISLPIGEGGFGITYAAVNSRMGTDVAIKELYWKDHVFRREDSSDPTDESVFYQIKVLKDEYADDFEQLKQKFLQEARVLRDFEQESAIVRVLDCFEANGTAYMVMEYLKGSTLKDYVKEHGCMHPETLFRSMLPVIDSLENVHKTGLIHRDISPDNIMRLEDGSFKLLDFGAARKFHSVADGKYTVIAKDSYSPPEQYDKKGLQGPWSDVYALCATMYECLTQTSPSSAVQRMFLDELPDVSALNPAVEKCYNAILMKGLSMKAEKRQASMSILKEDIMQALPVLSEDASKAKKRQTILLSIITFIIFCICLTVGLLTREQDKFKGITTEQFKLYAPADMSDEDFALAQENVENKLTAFAGEDNYLLSAEENSLQVTLPLACFKEQEISDTLISEFLPLADPDYPQRILEDSAYQASRTFTYSAEVQANWENINATAFKGDYQCNIEDFKGTTVSQVYSTYDSDSLSKGKWASVIIDLKERLDSLEAPYAFGTLYGDEHAIVIRTNPETNGRFLTQTLGSSAKAFTVSGDWWNKPLYLSASDHFDQTTNENGQPVLSLILGKDNRSFSAYKKNLLKNGENTLYLCYDKICCLLSARMEESGSDDQVDFDIISLKGTESLPKGIENIYQYIISCHNRSSIDSPYIYQTCSVCDKDGRILFDVTGDELYGIQAPVTRACKTFLDVAAQMKEAGYSIKLSDSNGDALSATVFLDMENDEHLIEDGLKKVQELCKTYDLANIPGEFGFYLDKKGLVLLSLSDYGTGQYGRHTLIRNIFSRDKSDRTYGAQLKAQLEKALKTFTIPGITIQNNDY